MEKKMSLMLPLCLFLIGMFFSIFLLEEIVEEFVGFLFAGYIVILVVFVPICAIGVGAYAWLKHGEWLTISPKFLLSYLDEENYFRVHLLSDTSFVGLQRISEWYISQNLGWSCIVVGILISWCTMLLKDE
jgi:hypothetical protein